LSPPPSSSAAPPGSLDFEWSVDYFASPAGALDVKQAREANLTSLGFQAAHHSRLSGLVISAFSRTQANTALANQIWYWVDDNALLAVSDTGSSGRACCSRTSWASSKTFASSWRRYRD